MKNYLTLVIVFFLIITSSCKKEERTVFPPGLEFINIITPNGDGDNDYFRIQSSGDINAYQIQIRNSDGIMMMNAKDIKENHQDKPYYNDPYWRLEIASWDAKYKGEKVPDGCYPYYLYVKFDNGDEYNYHGILEVYYGF
jgi:hypothetical protein